MSVVVTRAEARSLGSRRESPCGSPRPRSRRRPPLPGRSVPGPRLTRRYLRRPPDDAPIAEDRFVTLLAWPPPARPRPPGPGRPYRRRPTAAPPRAGGLPVRGGPRRRGPGPARRSRGGGRAFLAGTVLGFLVLLGLGLVGGELVSGARYEAEEVLRSTLGWWVLTLAVAVPVFVPAHAAATLAVTRALLAEGLPRTDVPPDSVRRRVAESSPAGLAGLAWTYLVLALLAGAVGLFAMDRDDAERTPAVAVSAAVGVVTAVGLLLLPGLRAAGPPGRTPCARHGTERGALRRGGGAAAARGARPVRTLANRRAGRAPERPGGRRAGRRRDGRRRPVPDRSVDATPAQVRSDWHYGPVGEVSIDVLVGVGGGLVGATLLLGAVWLLLPVPRDGRRRRAGLALLRSPEPSAPPADDVVRELLSPWSASTTVALVLLAGSGMLAPSVLAWRAAASRSWSTRCRPPPWRRSWSP